jgi:GNAT superfamily N-acetyltransferase
MIMLHGSNADNSAVCRTFSAARTYLRRMQNSHENDSRIGALATDVMPGVIRKLWIGEASAFRDHLLRLDPESRRFRFGSSVNAYFIERYAARALSADAIVHGYFVDGTLRAAAELRRFGGRFPFHAEAALSVERPWQDRGVGSALLERAILAAQNRGIRTVQLNCMSANRRMQAIARKHDASLRFRTGDVVGEVANPVATPLSLLREFVADGHGMAAALFDLQSRLLRAA